MMMEENRVSPPAHPFVFVMVDGHNPALIGRDGLKSGVPFSPEPQGYHLFQRCDGWVGSPVVCGEILGKKLLG
jgi:hypothetical protein